MSQWHKWGVGILCCLLVWSAGCSEKDKDRIGKVSGKALDKAQEWTDGAGDKIGVPLRQVQGVPPEVEVGERVQTRLRWDQVLQGANIRVHTDKGTVTLTGSVASDVQRKRAVELTESTIGVEKVTESLEMDR